MKELVVYPDERLRAKSSNVVEFGSVLTPAIEDMTWVMRTLTGNGIGITAVQCGTHLKMAILELNYKEKKKGHPLFIANPQVLKVEGMRLGSEGCLSFPGQFHGIKRPTLVWLEYQDQEGRKHRQFFHELWARCVLHEVDHFEGVLIIDRLKEQEVETSL